MKIIKQSYEFHIAIRNGSVKWGHNYAIGINQFGTSP